MSTLFNPVGPNSSSVYWVRRVLILALIVALIVAVILGLRKLLPGGDDATSTTPTTAPTSGQGETTTPNAQPSTPAPTAAAASAAASPTIASCSAQQIEIVATTDKESYPRAAKAKLGMTITNTSETPCTMDFGNGPLELRVTSGSDRIWSSDDCQTEANSDMRTIQPGEAGRMVSTVEWALKRSAEGCKSADTQVRPGNYRLIARAGDLQSQPKAFIVT